MVNFFVWFHRIWNGYHPHMWESWSFECKSGCGVWASSEERNGKRHINDVCISRQFHHMNYKFTYSNWRKIEWRKWKSALFYSNPFNIFFFLQYKLEKWPFTYTVWGFWIDFSIHTIICKLKNWRKTWLTEWNVRTKAEKNWASNVAQRPFSSFYRIQSRDYGIVDDTRCTW